jgi:hypothetical protein
MLVQDKGRNLSLRQLNHRSFFAERPIYLYNYNGSLRHTCDSNEIIGCRHFDHARNPRDMGTLHCWRLTGAMNVRAINLVVNTEENVDENKQKF